jgi:anion-transporting  ArsA/GET3 family ATPase
MPWRSTRLLRFKKWWIPVRCFACLASRLTRHAADTGMQSMMQDLAFAIPGVDEALAFAELMK